AFVAIYSPCHDQYFAVVINLTTSTVESFELIKCARPSWTFTIDNANVISLISNDPRFIAAMARRGITKEDIDCQRVQFCVAVDGRLDNLCGCDNKLCPGKKKCQHNSKCSGQSKKCENCQAKQNGCNACTAD